MTERVFGTGKALSRGRLAGHSQCGSGAYKDHGRDPTAAILADWHAFSPIDAYGCTLVGALFIRPSIDASSWERDTTTQEI
jgi:hypothetical protein